MEVNHKYQHDPSALGKLYIHSTASPAAASPGVQVQTTLAQGSAAIVNSQQTPVGGTTPGQTTTTGRLIPLSTVATFSRGIGPLLVNHLSQLPSATISFNLRDGVSLSAATDQVQTLTKQTLPGTITTSFQGTAQIFQSSLQNLTLLMLVAVLVIYLVLGIL